MAAVTVCSHCWKFETPEIGPCSVANAVSGMREMFSMMSISPHCSLQGTPVESPTIQKAEHMPLPTGSSMRASISPYCIETSPRLSSWAEVYESPAPLRTVIARLPAPSRAEFSAVWVLVESVPGPQPLLPSSTQLAGFGGAPAGPANSSDQTRRR